MIAKLKSVLKFVAYCLLYIAIGFAFVGMAMLLERLPTIKLW